MATQTPKFKFRTEDILAKVLERQSKEIVEWKAAQAEFEAAVKERRKEVLAALQSLVAALKKGDTPETYIKANGALVVNGRVIVNDTYDLKAFGIDIDRRPVSPPGRKPCHQTTIDFLSDSTTGEVLLTEAAYASMVGSSCGEA